MKPKKSKKGINERIGEVDDELTTLLQANLEFNVNHKANELIDELFALISIAANLAAEHKHAPIDTEVIDDIADLLV